MDNVVQRGSSAPFRMRLSLSVLYHLGLNLYSNIPALIAEVVANSWDADVTKVAIDIDRDSGRITVTNDCLYMTQSELNNRLPFLSYRRQEVQKTKTAKGRHVVGRKDIGKCRSSPSPRSASAEQRTRSRDRGGSSGAHLPSTIDELVGGAAGMAAASVGTLKVVVAQVLLQVPSEEPLSVLRTPE